MTLLPCPFCGGEAVTALRRRWRVFCGENPACEAKGPWRATEDEAIAAWNRRAPALPPTQPRADGHMYYDSVRDCYMTWTGEAWVQAKGYKP